MKTNQEIAKEVLNGLWGNGQARREKLEKAGYNYNEVQTIVNALVYERDNSGGASHDEIPVEETEITIDESNLMIIDYDVTKYSGIKINFLGVD